mgnify:CR=1 FL=1
MFSSTSEVIPNAILSLLISIPGLNDSFSAFDSWKQKPIASTTTVRTTITTMSWLSVTSRFPTDL